MSFGPRLKWIKDKFIKLNYTQLSFFIIALFLSYTLIKYSSVKYLFVTVLIATAIYLFFSSFADLFKKSIQYPQKISHLAFSIFIISILINGIYSKEFNSNMRVGDEIDFMNKKIKFKSINFESKDNYNLLRGNFEIQEIGKKNLNFFPEIRIYTQPIISTSEADIKTNLLNDNFIVISLLKEGEIFNVRYQQKPFMIWIWISLIILTFGGTLSLIRR